MENDSSSGSDDQEMRDRSHDLPIQSANDDVTMNSISTRRRGRPRLEPLWSRIIDLDNIGDEDPEVYNINDDIQEMTSVDNERLPRDRKSWIPLFQPKDFWRENDLVDLESNTFEKAAL